MPPGQQASTAVSTFASLLARFVAQAPASAVAAKDDGLADDVVSLSYEQALQAHARYRPAASLDALRADEFALPNSDLPPSSQPEQIASQAAASPPDAANRRKSASVTIRMSHEESEQLRARAAAAGLTISAYLRSCIFEVESLRAQVKDALAQLRAESPAAPLEQEESVPPLSTRWRFFSRRHSAARA
jgi:predicted DNA binding CopG/RHH family protein